MPTLIRLIVILLVLGGLAYGAMFALVVTVTPKDKDVTIRIPARDLVPTTARDPLVRREIDTARTQAVEAAAPEAVPAIAPPEPASGDAVTLAPGIE